MAVSIDPKPAGLIAERSFRKIKNVSEDDFGRPAKRKEARSA